MAERTARRLTLAALLLACAAAFAADQLPTASIVRFNTVCTNCHEGECSGRLSFHTGAKEALGHMQRYLGSISDSQAENLFVLLRHTKERCAPYPLTSPISAGHALNAGELSAWRNPQEGGYYIPLGHLAQGEYRLQIDLAVTGNGTLKITDSQFEPLVEESLCPQQKQLDIRFQVVPGSHYLAIKAPVVLDSLRLTAATRP